MSKVILLDTENEDYVSPQDAKPPDKAHLETRYKLQLRAMKLSRQSYRPPEATSNTWEYEGNAWVQDTNGSWVTNDHDDIPIDADILHDYRTYAEQTHVVFNAMTSHLQSKSPPVQSSTNLLIQCDHGANASITSSFDALENVQWIQPTLVASADKKSQLTVRNQNSLLSAETLNLLA